MIAQDLIKTISHNIKAQLPAWWYSIFCKFLVNSRIYRWVGRVSN